LLRFTLQQDRKKFNTAAAISAGTIVPIFSELAEPLTAEWI